MSKKNKRRRQQRKSFPWLLIVLGGVLVVVALSIANRARDGGGTPSIAVDQQKIDYGYVKFGENRSFAIKVTNTGSGTLRFKEQPYIEVLKGC